MPTEEILPFEPESFGKDSVLAKIIGSLKNLISHRRIALDFTLEPPNAVGEKILNQGGGTLTNGLYRTTKLGIEIKFHVVEVLPGFWFTTHSLLTPISFDVIRRNPIENGYFEIFLSHTEKPIHYRENDETKTCQGIIAPPGVDLRLIMLKKYETQFLTLFIEKETINGLLDLESNQSLHDKLHKQAWIIPNQKTNFSQDALINRRMNVNINSASDKLETHTIAIQILNGLVKSLEENDSNIQIHNEKSLSLAQKVKTEILKDLSDTPKIEDLAKLFHTNKNQIQNEFKEVYGSSVYQYFLKHRMNEAKSLLEKGEMTVSEIGYSLGYTNMGNFAKKFKDFHNATPKDFLGNS